MPVVPKEWLDKVRMVGIVVHWTAGNNKSSADDRQHYHVVIDSDGTVKRGKPIKANATVGGALPGNYAAHTRGHNSNIIGVSMACMASAVEPTAKEVASGKAVAKYGKHPMTKAQWDKMCLVVAELCDFYDIAVTKRTVLSHAEVQPTLEIPQRGKWDVTVIPWLGVDSPVGAVACGDYMRKQIVTGIAEQERAPARAPSIAEPIRPEAIVPVTLPRAGSDEREDVGTDGRTVIGGPVGRWTDAEIDAAMVPGAESDLSQWVQESLVALQYPEVGVANRKYGSKTAGAIAMFKLNNNVGGAPDRIDRELIDALVRGLAERWPRPVAKLRAEAQATDPAVQQRLPEVGKSKEVVQQVQTANWWTRFIQWFTGGTAVGGGALGLVSNVQKAKEQAVDPWWSLLGENPGWTMIYIAIGLVAVTTIVLALNKAQALNNGAAGKAEEAAEDATQAFRDGRRSI